MHDARLHLTKLVAVLKVWEWEDLFTPTLVCDLKSFCENSVLYIGVFFCYLVYWKVAVFLICNEHSQHCLNTILAMLYLEWNNTGHSALMDMDFTVTGILKAKAFIFILLLYLAAFSMMPINFYMSYIFMLMIQLWL